MWIDIRPGAPPFKQDVPTIFMLQITKSPCNFHENDLHLIKIFLALDPNFIDFEVDHDSKEIIVTEVPVVRPIEGSEPIKKHYLSMTDWLVYEPHNNKVVVLTNTQFINDKNYGVSSIKVPTTRKGV